jgi:hypothetical protein
MLPGRQKLSTSMRSSGGLQRSAGYGENWHSTPEAVAVVSELCLGRLEEGEAEFRKPLAMEPNAPFKL